MARGPSRVQRSLTRGSLVIYVCTRKRIILCAEVPGFDFLARMNISARARAPSGTVCLSVVLTRAGKLLSGDRDDWLEWMAWFYGLRTTGCTFLKT